MTFFLNIQRKIDKIQKPNFLLRSIMTFNLDNGNIDGALKYIIFSELKMSENEEISFLKLSYLNRFFHEYGKW